MSAAADLPKPFRFRCEVGKCQAVLDVVWKDASRPMTSNHLCWDARLAEAVWNAFGARYDETQGDVQGVPLAWFTRPAAVPFMLSMMTAHYARVAESPSPREVAHTITHFEIAWAWSVLDRVANVEQ